MLIEKSHNNLKKSAIAHPSELASRFLKKDNPDLQPELLETMNIVSKARHAQLWKPSAITVSNARLSDLVISSQEFQVDSLRLNCAGCHLGPGIFTNKSSPGMHQHDEAQIEIPLSGHFYFTVEDKEIPLGAGQALVIPPHTPHDWNTPRGGFMLGILIKVRDLLGTDANLPYSLKKRQSPIESPTLTSHLQQLMDLLVRRSSTPFTQAICSSLLKALIAEILDSVCVFPKKAQPKDTNQLRKNLIFEQTSAFIKSNINHALQAKELSIQAGIGFRQLTRIFLNSCGEAPHQYILRLRFEQARALIDKNPLKPIKEIAYECGFYSPSHLTTTFKKNLGISPRAYATQMTRRK